MKIRIIFITDTKTKSFRTQHTNSNHFRQIKKSSLISYPPCKIEVILNPLYRKQVISCPPFKYKSFQAMTRVSPEGRAEGVLESRRRRFFLFFPPPINAHKLTTVCNTMD